jgi:hypothetical protein
MDNRSDYALVSDLQYALVVMEEYSYLGLDEEFARKLKNVLLRRIAETESELATHPVAPAEFWESQVCA